MAMLRLLLENDRLAAEVARLRALIARFLRPRA